MSSGVHNDLGFLAGGGELGERIRSFDWSQTPLGPVELWPNSLRTAVRIMLASQQPIWIGWGPELTYLYNDPYKSIIGGKHPAMLGQPIKTVWAEIWDVIAPMLETALTGESGIYVESQLLIMERHGYREETYYTFSYSPIPDDDGSSGGIICANTDDTQRVLGERRLGLLRELGTKTAEGLSWQEVCTGAAAALANDPRDLPFASLYMLDEDGSGFTLAGASGVDPGAPTAPTRVPIESERAERLLQVLGQKDIVVIDVRAVAVAPLPTGVWDEPPRQAAYVPLSAAVQGEGDGVLVVGLNPFRPLDASYSDFLGLIGAQISASLATAQAYEGERRRAESLAELDRAKTIFFSNLSHEFRTPLTLMLGPLDDVLAEPDAVRADVRESIEVVRRNALRLQRMVNTVLDFSRAGSDQATSTFRRTDLAQITSDLADRFAPLLERSGVRLVRHIERLREPAYVDGDAWDKIVLNLLSNAYKFTLAGEIAITLRQSGETVRLSVRDTGSGVPEAEVPLLFERFHRVRNERARTQEGTGIGLALVRELVELHGGTVSVESALGVGTTFTIELPLGSKHLDPSQVSEEWSEASTAGTAIAFTEEASRWAGIDVPHNSPAMAAEDGVRPARERRRVLVVDDNADMRDYIVRLLERHWLVEAYPDGQAALERIRIAPPALVVTDVMMPRLDGLGLLAALRDDPATAPIPVIVVSARAGEETSVEGLELGADDYLVKPFSARELVARVRANLELSRLRTEAARLAALEEVRSRVIMTVSHELRTPVTAIYGAARTLERDDVLDVETRRQLQAVIGVEAARLARITSDILTTESLAAGLVSMNRAAIDVRILVEEAVRSAQARRVSGIELQLRLPPEPVIVDADRTRLEQVLANLLDNAIKYSPDGGNVWTALEVVGGSALITVADNGIGIPDGASERVFERFYRVDPELANGISGSGLGLFISRQIVEAMGGRIALEPNRPRGTKFTVSLPVG